MKSFIQFCIVFIIVICITACNSSNKVEDILFKVDNPFGNSLIPDMIADASITEFDGTYYCYATTDGYGRGLETSGPPTVWKSTDFVNWSFEGNYFPSAANQKYWAPSKAVKANGKYYIYPTINGYMYPAVADSPEGPFKLAKGKDKFELPYTPSTLLQQENRGGIDTEIFIDDDGQAYAFWGRRCVAKLEKDMITLDSHIDTIVTPRKAYSEGPVFFKRKGIYYYLYTQGGDEKYQYAYVMSRHSPMGPYETPKEDIITTTDYKSGVFGPGHGCVYNPVGTDDYYFAYLEFGRNSTNRQTYVNRMEFNEDGTIRPISLSLDGVGTLRKVEVEEQLQIVNSFASSSRAPLKIRHFKDEKCKRIEYFTPEFAFDNANGSRWMVAQDDTLQSWLVADLGKTKKINRSELFFVRPTAGHAYLLEGSTDGVQWRSCGGHGHIEKRSPHVDQVNDEYRYLRVKILKGIRGIWEWKLF